MAGLVFLTLIDTCTIDLGYLDTPHRDSLLHHRGVRGMRAGRRGLIYSSICLVIYLSSHSSFHH